MKDNFAQNLTSTFLRRSLWIAVIFCGIISVALPTLIYYYHSHQYELESAEIIKRFIDEDICFRPEYLLDNPKSRAAAVEHINAFMKFGQLVEFKLWSVDSTLVYAYRGANQVGKRFPGNSRLAEVVRTGAVRVDTEEPGEGDSRYLAGFGKLVEVYAPIIANGEVIGVVEVYRTAPKYHFLKIHIAMVLSIAVFLFVLLYLLLAGQFRRAATELLAYDARLGQAYSDLGHSYIDTIRSLIKALELRDMETEGHSERVVALSIFVARRLGLEEREIDRLVLGAYLHDIGKIGIPDSILHKPGSLSDFEFNIVRTHVKKGLEIIGAISFLEPASEVIRYHHERWDGSGYSEGLKGREIPVSARIFAVVDVFDALVGNRPYRQPFSFAEAKDVIARGSGSHFDPEIVALFLTVSEQDYEELRGEIAVRGIHHTVNEAVSNLLAESGEHPLPGFPVILPPGDSQSPRQAALK